MPGATYVYICLEGSNATPVLEHTAVKCLLLCTLVLMAPAVGCRLFAKIFCDASGDNARNPYPRLSGGHTRPIHASVEEISRVRSGVKKNCTYHTVFRRCHTGAFSVSHHCRIYQFLVRSVVADIIACKYQMRRFGEIINRLPRLLAEMAHLQAQTMPAAALP